MLSLCRLPYNVHLPPIHQICCVATYRTENNGETERPILSRTIASGNTLPSQVSDIAGAL